MNTILETMLEHYPQLEAAPVEAAFQLLLKTARSGGLILTCGNGGSAADAEHIVGELMKGFLLRRPLPPEERAAFAALGPAGEAVAEKLQRGIPAIALTSQSALLTAVGNDTAFDMVFAQQVWAYGRQGDCLIAMTTSGGSGDVVNAAVAARARGMGVVGITGENAGALGPLCDVCLRMPSAETYRVQEYTLPVYHALCALLEQALFGGGEGS